MYLLDTNVVSELRKADRAAPQVSAWAASVPTPLMFLSSISLFEIEHGVLLVERRDETQGAVLRSWFQSAVLPAFDGRVLALDGRTARRAAAFHVPDPAPFRDSLIAATAELWELTVVTRNLKDFARSAGSTCSTHGPERDATSVTCPAVRA